MQIILSEGIDSGYHSAPNDLREGIRRCVVPLVIIEDGKVISIGTGTIIASWGLILTASHVLEAAIRKGRPRAKNGRRYQEYELYALVRTGEDHPELKNTELGGLVPIKNMWMSEALDVGFCVMGSMVDRVTGDALTYHCIPMNIKPPAAGQQTFAIGFPVANGEMTEETTVEYGEELYTTTGPVLEVYMTGRDKVVLPYPSFAIEGKFEHNMSGGPVFLDGEVGVSGIISRGLDDKRAYASMLWPGLGIRTDYSEEGFPRYVQEAVERGYIEIVDTGHSIHILEGEGDGVSRVRLIHPEE